MAVKLKVKVEILFPFGGRSSLSLKPYQLRLLGSPAAILRCASTVTKSTLEQQQIYENIVMLDTCSVSIMFVKLAD